MSLPSAMTVSWAHWSPDRVVVMPPELDTPFWLKPHALSGGWLDRVWPSTVIVAPRNAAATVSTSAGRSREHAAGAGEAGPAVPPAAAPPAGTGLEMPGRPGEPPQPASAAASRPAAMAAAAAPGRRMVMGLMRTP